jgi:hypothetical protein
MTSNFNIKKEENSIKKENLSFINENISKSKYAMLNLLHKYNNKKNQQNVISKNPFLVKNLYKNKIRNYINSNITFNSKIIKFLATSNNYSFNKYNKLNNLVKNNIYEFLQGSFISMFSLISKPVYFIRPDKIVIQLFYLLLKNTKISKGYKNNSIFILENKNKLNIICNILTCFFKKPIELNLVRLNYPYYNSEILVKLIGMFVNKIQLRRIVKNFIFKSINKNNQLIPSKLTGIIIKVAGRLMTQRVIPRKTIKIINKGALSRNKAMFTETARFTNKNKRGAFSITVTLGHTLNNSRRSYSTNIHNNKNITPLITYPDFFKSKLEILINNKNKAGVYRFTNKLNMASYIGSSINLSIRLSQHFNINYVTKRSKNSFFYNALLKYGYENFTLDWNILIKIKYFYYFVNNFTWIY